MTDLRWTGGIANRGWQSGTRPGPVTDADDLAAQVSRYLTDCRRHRKLLSPANHPTLKSCLQVVFHHGDAQKRLIGDIYRQLTGVAAP
jgi:hypothetical protein